MNKLLNGYPGAQRLDSGLLVFTILSVLLPVICLAAFGLFAVFRYSYWTELLAVLLVSSLAISLSYLIYRRRVRPGHPERAEADGEIDSLVQASSEWSEFDLEIWQILDQFIEQSVLPDTEWLTLRPMAWGVAERVAQHYYPASKKPSLEFSAPEFLLMIEELSRRYRKLLKTHVPYVEKVNITLITRGYHHRGKVKAAKKLYDVYRVLRLFTPEGVMAEARGRLTGQLFDQLSTRMQLQLKRAVLQEAASVAIDLYSKRFALTYSELGTSEAVLRDERLQAPAIEPLRVVFVGQVSAGKSSLINGLMGTLSAEVSTLPCTPGVAIYQCQLEGIDLLHLVDLPGLDGTEAVEKLVLEQMTLSDLVVWVLQANQPARNLDKKLKASFDLFYQQAENRSRRKPTVVAVISQVDRLAPRAEWQPPGDLEHDDSPAARLIRDAVAYNVELLQPDQALAASASEDRPHFNVDQLVALISDAYQQGVNTQLNRRRNEDSGPMTRQQAQRLLQLGKTMWQQVGH